MKAEKRNSIKHKLHQDLGEDLDIDLAWEDFRQKKRKERLFPWWQYSGCLLIILGGLIAGIWLKSVANKTSLVLADSAIKNAKEIVVIKPTTIEQESIFPPKSSIELSSEKAEKILNEAATISASIKLPKHPAPNDKIEVSPIITKSKQQQTINNPLKNTLTHFSIATNNSRSIDGQLSTKTTANNPLQTPNNALPITKKASRLFEEVPLLFIPSALLSIEQSELPLFIPKKLVTPSLWEIGLSYQLSTVNRHLKGTNTAYINRRNTNETFLEANQLQVAIRRKLTPRFYLQSGIHFERYRASIVDRFQTFEPKVFENQVVEIIRDGTQVENVIGDVTGTQENFYINTRFQQYLATSIPIQLGIQRPLTNTLRIDFTTGIRLSIWHQHIGNTFQSATSIGTYQAINQLGYKNAGVITGLSSLSLSQKIGRYTKINLGMQAHYDLTNRLSDDAGNVDKFYGYGLQIGLIRQLRF